MASVCGCTKLIVGSILNFRATWLMTLFYFVHCSGTSLLSPPGTAENVNPHCLIVRCPHFRNSFIHHSIYSLEPRQLPISVCVLHRSFTVSLHSTCSGRRFFWICLTLDIFLIQDGFTPMYFAAQGNHPRLVELLLAHGADINRVSTVHVM